MLQIDLISALLLIGIGQGVFLTITLWLRTEKQRQANRFLALYIVTITLTLADEFMLYVELEQAYPMFTYLFWPAVFLTGPTLWWYLRSLLEQEFQFGREQFPHFIPFLLSIGVMLPFYLLPASVKLPQLLPNAVDSDYTWHIYSVDVVFYAMMVHIGIYTVAFLRYIWNYREQRRHTFSTEASQLFNWLALLSALYATCWILFLLSDFAGLLGDLFWVLMASGLAVFMFIVSYFAMRWPILFEQSEVALPPTAVEESAATTPTPTPAPNTPSPSAQTKVPKKYYASSLSGEQAAYIQQKLLTLMETEQPYLEGKLTLPQLAERLNVSANHLSQVINEQLTSNFFDFVNRYRVEDAKRLLIADPSRTVLDVALDAGFNSKSAFYSSFRQHAQMTPSQFRKKGAASAESHGSTP